MKLTIETNYKGKPSTVNIICDQYIIFDIAGKVIATNKILITDEHDKQFDKFWDDYGKVGNKSKAREMYFRSLKAGITADHLNVKLGVYLKFLKVTGQYQMHCSTWLNPRHKEFENENDISAQQSKKTVPKKTVPINYEEKL